MAVNTSTKFTRYYLKLLKTSVPNPNKRTQPKQACQTQTKLVPGVT